MSNVVLIPARGGSKGIKLKNITPVLGKPLLYYTSVSAQNSDSVDRIVVATDSPEIKRTALSFGFDKLEVYDRKKENAQDKSKSIDLILEYIKFLKPDDTLVLIQATSPLTTSEDISAALEDYANSDCDSMLTCTETDGFFWTNEGAPILHEVNNRQRRQDYTCTVLRENGAIYINKVKNIQENKSLLSGKIKPYIMSKETQVEIDEMEDIFKIENILKKRIVRSMDFSGFKMILTDCDGTLTDGGMYYSKTGEKLKKFNTKDGFGLKRMRDKGFVTGIITGEDNDIVRSRAEKLNIDELHMGIGDKLPVVKKLAAKYNISLDEIIYVGDDLNDIDVIKNVGFGCATANANSDVKDAAKYVTSIPGGLGAVREVIDFVLTGRQV